MVQLDKICRICLLEKDEMRSVLDPGTMEVVSISGDIEISTSDGLPELVCLECLEKAHQSYSFREQCKRSDTFLRAFRQEQVSDIVEYIEPEEEEVADASKLEREAVDAINQAINQYQSTATGEEQSNEIIEFLTEKALTEINDDLVEEYMQQLQPTTTTSTLETEIVEAHDMLLHCEHCAKNFVDWKTYNRHMKRHSDKIWICSTCGQNFRQSSHLRTHEKIHQSVKEHECQQCFKRFRLAGQLRVHVKTHENRKDYICGYCSATFGQKINLQNHVRSRHTFERPFACHFCNDAAFPTQGELKHHIQKVHEGVKKPPRHFCPTCGRGVNDLRQHMRTHEPAEAKKKFQCPECPKAYLMHSHLIVHMRSHRNERPFKCSSCGMAFAAKEVLKRHQVVHSGVKNYACGIGDCTKTFSQPSARNTHRKRKHTTVEVAKDATEAVETKL